MPPCVDVRDVTPRTVFEAARLAPVTVPTGNVTVDDSHRNLRISRRGLGLEPAPHSGLVHATGRS